MRELSVFLAAILAKSPVPAQTGRTNYVDNHRIGAMLLDDGLESRGDRVQRRVPVAGFTIHLRLQQASLQVQCLAQRRALGTKPAEIGRMLRVALDGDRAVGSRRGDDTAADTAIGTGSFDFVHSVKPFSTQRAQRRKGREDE